TLWRPTVSDAHARKAVTLLEQTVEAGRDRWTELDTDDQFPAAGGWLDDAREALAAGNTHEALFDARYGMQFAAEALGIALARLDAVDLPTLADRGYALLDRAQQVLDDITPYPVETPARDLAWYYRIEEELRFGRRHVRWAGIEAARNGVHDADGPDRTDFEPYEIGQLLAGLGQGEIHILSAEQYRDRHDAVLDAPTDTYADQLAAVASRFKTVIDRFPDRDEVLAEYLDGSTDEETSPYEFAHHRLVRWCYDTGYYVVLEENQDLSVVPAVELSKGIAQRRAHDLTTEQLVVDPADEGFDSGHTLAEKRRAQSVYRSVVGSSPPPLLTLQVMRAVEDLQVAKVGFAGSYQQPIWRERLEAYLYALVGRAKLREYPTLYRRIVGDSG
ncbi:MAG: hypothetical protein SVG88_10440, partial [Halobacteriales archaeon]|nr:hypothetical protein [Halobacteriales archaeon]